MYQTKTKHTKREETATIYTDGSANVTIYMYVRYVILTVRTYYSIPLNTVTPKTPAAAESE